MAGLVLITGGSRGIGAAAARLLASRGHPVAINYRADAEAASNLAKEIEAARGTAICIQGDVGSEADIEAMFETLDKADLGPLWGLVNNAGISVRGNTAEISGEALQRLMAVNVIGLILCCREAVRRMSTSRGGAGGVIVNISSMAATHGGRPGSIHYAATKGAVDVYTTGLAREVAEEGIRVNVVRPGMIETDMTAGRLADPEFRAEINHSIPLGRVGTPEEIAAPIAWLLSDEASFVSGSHLNAGGGGIRI